MYIRKYKTNSLILESIPRLSLRAKDWMHGSAKIEKRLKELVEQMRARKKFSKLTQVIFLN